MFPTHPERLSKRKNSSEFAPQLESARVAAVPCSFRSCSVKIRGKARDTNLTLHRTDADFFEVSRARNGGVDADGSYGFATDFAETATETARSDSV